VIDRDHIDRFRTIVVRRFGLQYDSSRLDFLGDVLRERMAALGTRSFDAYAERLSAADPTELRALAEQLTVTETFFFRNSDHFRALKGHVLPERMRARGQDRRLQILSAGCASGEEPYSIAVSVREALVDLSSWDVKITGLDVNPSMIAKATRARYSSWSLRSTSEELRARHFVPEGKELALRPEIQQMVSFEERNLTEEDPLFWQSSSFDVVFCRNVVMYFAPEVAREVVRRIRRALVPGGFLFLGHAETLRGLSHEFHLCHTHETFYYQRRDGAQSAAIETHPIEPAITRALPEVVDSTDSWVEVIQRASERIAALAKRGSIPSDRTAPVSMPPVVRSWDLGLVFEALRQERFAEALEILSALPPEAHRDPDALLLRAALLTNGGRLAEAEDVCRGLLSIDELNAGAHYLMALCREHDGDASGAIDHDQTAIYLDPEFAMPHLHLGLMARRSEDRPQARRELGQALALLSREEASRLLLFGGGFTREALSQLCRTELGSLGDEP
jgi:chemotaxis protein methyltransferase CheR